MKSRILIVVFIQFIICFACCAQDNSAYKKAFDYIVDDNRGKDIQASKTIVHIYLAGFEEDISKFLGKSEKTVEKMVDSIDWPQTYFRMYDKRLKRFHIKGDQPNMIVYFSNINNNLFGVELIRIKGTDLSYDYQVFQNVSVVYLFYWDPESKILQELGKHKVTYN